MAFIRSSSVMFTLLIVAIALLVALDLADCFACSLRDEFFAFTGILPVTYLAALPAPFFAAGARRAVTSVERGMIAVSSSYPTLGQHLG